MYNIIKNLIPAGGYKLAELQHKIKKMYLIGDLDEAQMDELLAMASGNISADAERPGTLAMLQSLHTEIKALAERVATLERGDTDEGGEAEGFPAWEPWDGISDNYQHGAIVKHKGSLWQSTFTGQNVWEPGAAGTEALWAVYNE